MGTSAATIELRLGHLPGSGLRLWTWADEYEQLHRFAVIQRRLFKTFQVIPGAGTSLRRLSVEGYRIWIITRRLYINFFHELAVPQTVRWLDGHRIPYRDLCFMSEKDQLGADVYIDDAPVNIEAPRAENWDEAYKLIKERYSEPRR